MKKYIKILRNNFRKYNIDGYVIPKNDEYFTEYSRVNRLKIISNFSRKYQIYLQEIELDVRCFNEHFRD